MLGKLFKSLFSSSEDGKSNAKGSSKAKTVTYDDFTIIAEPQPTNGQWQVSGRIEKPFGLDDIRAVIESFPVEVLPPDPGSFLEPFEKGDSR